MTSVTNWTLPRESLEWVGPFTLSVTVNGVTSAVNTWTAAVVPVGTRPTSFVAPSLQDGGYGVLVGPTSTVGTLAPGDYNVWIKYTSNPEAPVLLAATLHIT